MHTPCLKCHKTATRLFIANAQLLFFSALKLSNYHWLIYNVLFTVYLFFISSLFVASFVNVIATAFFVLFVKFNVSTFCQHNMLEWIKAETNWMSGQDFGQELTPLEPVLKEPRDSNAKMKMLVLFPSF